MNQILFVNDDLVKILATFLGRSEVRIGDAGSQQVPGNSLAGVDTPAVLPDAIVEGVCRDLVQQIQHCRDLAASSSRSLSADMLVEFSYLMAAMADEMLITTLQERLPRDFRGAIEHRIFGTRDAGEQVFMRIERLIARRSQLDGSLAGAYLLAISVGFKGQYLWQNTRAELANYHESLSPIALLPAPPQRGLGSSLAGEAAGESGLEVELHKRLPLIWAGVAALWLLAAFGMDIMWRQETSDVRVAIAELGQKPASSLQVSRQLQKDGER